MTKLIIATIAATLAVAAPAHAATTAQAKRAVTAEVKDQRLYAPVGLKCTKLTSRYFRCSFEYWVSGGTLRDGDARVRFYGSTPDVFVYFN